MNGRWPFESDAWLCERAFFRVFRGLERELIVGIHQAMIKTAGPTTARLRESNANPGESFAVRVGNSGIIGADRWRGAL